MSTKTRIPYEPAKALTEQEKNNAESHISPVGQGFREGKVSMGFVEGWVQKIKDAIRIGVINEGEGRDLTNKLTGRETPHSQGGENKG